MQTSEKNWLEKLADKIPGLSGYQAREGRRDTDKRLRECIASQMDRVRDRVEDAKLALTNQGNLRPLNELGLLQRRLQGVADRIRFATYGYSGSLRPGEDPRGGAGSALRPRPQAGGRGGRAPGASWRTLRTRPPTPWPRRPPA